MYFSSSKHSSLLAATILLITWFIRSSLAYHYDPEWINYNLNANPDAKTPLEYSGQWNDHVYHPSPDNWRFPFYTLFLDRFVNGDPINDNINGTIFEHDPQSTQIRNGGDLQGLIDSLDYLQGMGIKGIYIAGSPFLNQPWTYDQYSPLDLSILDWHFGDINKWRETITEIHARDMYILLDNTFATMGDLVGFEGYLNVTTPFSLKEHRFQYKGDRQYYDFHLSNDYNASCNYPRMWLETGYPIGSDVTSQMIGCYDSEIDQYGDTEAFGVYPDWRRQLSKFASVQDRLREWHEPTRLKIENFYCMVIAQLDIDGFRYDKAMQATTDALGSMNRAMRECARKYGKTNFFLPGEITGGNVGGSIFVGRGRQPDMLPETLTIAATLSNNSTDDKYFIREAGMEALDAAAFHYTTYRSMTRFLGMDGNLAAGYDSPINWVDQFNNFLITNDLVNANTGKFDPRHMYGVTNQDVFRWGAIRQGIERQMLGHFVTTMLMPGIPLLLWGEEQAFYVLDNTATNYIFGRQPLSAATAWMQHGCYGFSNPSTQYYQMPLEAARYGCHDISQTYDHRDPTHPIRNILRHMYYMRSQFPVLNDGMFLQQLSNQTEQIVLPGSTGVPTETGFWSVLRSEFYGAQNLSSEVRGDVDVWLLYSNRNETVEYTFQCQDADSSHNTRALIAPFTAGIMVKNLFYPYEELQLERSNVSLGIRGSSLANGCVSNLTMAPFGFKAYVPKEEWVRPRPMLTKFVPGHDVRIESASPQDEGEDVEVEFQFSQPLDCDEITNSITFTSTTDEGTTPEIKAGSVRCIAIGPQPVYTNNTFSDPIFPNATFSTPVFTNATFINSTLLNATYANGTLYNITLPEPAFSNASYFEYAPVDSIYTGYIPSTFSWKAVLTGVRHGVHAMKLSSIAGYNGSEATNATETVIFRIGTSENPVVFPLSANYSSSLLTKVDDKFVVHHKASGADLWRYSTNWGSTFSEWLPYTGGNDRIVPQPWSGTKKQAWQGEHVRVEYFSRLSGQSDIIQHGDLNGAGEQRRFPHLFWNGPYNQFGYDAGLENSIEHVGNGSWSYYFMTEWMPSGNTAQVNVWGMNADNHPDQSFVYGDIDEDGILDRLPPSSLSNLVINITASPPKPYTAWEIRINDATMAFKLIPAGDGQIQMALYILMWTVPLLTACLSVWLYKQTFYDIKFNERGLMEKASKIPPLVRNLFKKREEPNVSDPTRKMPIYSSWLNMQPTFQQMSANLISTKRRRVLIATMEYDIEDWNIKVKIGGLGVMAQLMGKHLLMHDLIWVIPCVGDIQYPTDTPGESIYVVVMNKAYEVKVQYHVLRNITYVLLDAPVFRQQTMKNPYPARMDDMDSAIYYSAWNQCIAQTINRFPIDLYHINDYHGAVAPLYLLPRTIPCCLSLHNAEFQGLWPMRTKEEVQEVCAVFNLPIDIAKRYVQFGEIFNLLHSGASILREHQDGYGAVGVSKKYGKRAFARYAIFWGLHNIQALPNPDPADSAAWDKKLPQESDISIDTVFEASRGDLRRQAQEWAGLNQDPEADLFVFVGRWSMQKGVDLIADVFPSILEAYPSVQLITIGPVIDLYGKFAAAKLEKLMQVYPGRVYSKAEFTAIPPCIFSGAEFALVPSRDEPFGLVAVEFGRKGALGVGARIGGLGQMPGWWYTVESSTTNHLTQQFKTAIKQALASSKSVRALMRARSAKQRFPIAQWTEDLEILQSTSIKVHDMLESTRRKEASGFQLGLRRKVPARPSQSSVTSKATSGTSTPRTTSSRLSDVTISIPNFALLHNKLSAHLEPKKLKKRSWQQKLRFAKSSSTKESGQITPLRELRMSAGFDNAMEPATDVEANFSHEAIVPDRPLWNYAVESAEPETEPSTPVADEFTNLYHEFGEELPGINGVSWGVANDYRYSSLVHEGSADGSEADTTQTARTSTTNVNVAGLESSTDVFFPKILAENTVLEVARPKLALLPTSQSSLANEHDNTFGMVSQLDKAAIVGDKTDFMLQRVDPFFTDTTGEYFREFQGRLEGLDGSNSSKTCIEEFLVKSEKSYFDAYRDAKLGRGQHFQSKSALESLRQRRPHSSTPSEDITITELPNGSSQSLMSEPHQFLLGEKHVPPSGLRLLLQLRVFDWPVYSFLLAFGQIVSANSHQITLLTGEVGQAANKLYALASIYLFTSIMWWVLLRRLPAIYSLSLPWVFYGLAFLFVGCAHFDQNLNARGWIQNVGTACYAIGSSSGSIFFSMNFGDEGGAPQRVWVFRACMIQGTQQLWVVALWAWGHFLSQRSVHGMLASNPVNTSWRIVAICLPLAGAFWIIGLVLWLGLPTYYRQWPGEIPRFYKGITRRKIVLWFFVMVLVQNFFLSAPYGRNWSFLFGSAAVPAWITVCLVLLFFGLIWAGFMSIFARLSISHSWLLPLFAIGLGAPRWAQIWWATSGIGSYLPWAFSGSPEVSAIVSRCLWLWLGTLDVVQGVGIGMMLLVTLTRYHVTFTLVAAQVLGSIATIVGRAVGPNNIGPGPISPNILKGVGELSQAWFWVGLLCNLGLCLGFFAFFRKEQMSKT